MDTETEINTVKALVLNYLSKETRCRNDDKYLTWRVMRHFSPRMFIPFEDFEKLPAFETVKRCRAYIQNVEKKYPPTDLKVIEKRQGRQGEFKEKFRAEESEAPEWSR